MALYIVVRHPLAEQTWANQWDAARPGALLAFMTPKAVADRARGMGTVFVHRCGHGTEPPAVVCEARVRSTDAVGRDVLVRLEAVRTMAVVPSVTPRPGTNCYTAPEPR